MTAVSARSQGEHLIKGPSLRSRMIEWVLWRLRVKGRFTKTDGFRERVVKSRPTNPRPPRSFYRRYRVDETSQAGKPIFTISPRNGEARKHLLYLHGGAYVYEIMGMQWKMLARFLDEDDATITVPLYPLAPEYTCEQISQFVLGVYRVLQNDGKPIVVLGDSSGGGMALSLSQQLRNTGATQPAKLVLVSPWLDVTCSDPVQAILDRSDPLLAMPGLREAGIWYAGKLSPTDARVSPLYGDLNGLPPILVLTGTHDLLNSDAHRLQTLMASQPGALKMIEYRNMLHVWPSLPIREARQAMDQILTFMQIDSHQERAQTVGGEGNPPVPAPTKISGMRSATDDATLVKASDHSAAVVSRP
jgi:monoterpene epsilon-lactone hydrolase